MKTKGALLWELNSPFRIDEIEVGDPVDDEVQLRVHAAGMCHSDYHLTTGATPIGLPALGGHEGAGVVTKVGKNVTGIEEGDHVILAFIPACGACQPCLKGYRSLCGRRGGPPGGTRHCGGAPPGAPPRPRAPGSASAANVASVVPVEPVVIVCVGGIGISALQGAVISGARNVIAIDPN